MLHDQNSTSHPCPCGSGIHYNQCCEPAVEGSAPAKTAEQLMRSRYSAFALGMSDYLVDTTHPDFRQGLTTELLDEQIAGTTWSGLSILGTEAGSDQDEQGQVTFVAKFCAGGQQAQLRETSRFRKQNGRWYYLDGDVDVSEI